MGIRLTRLTLIIAISVIIAVSAAPWAVACDYNKCLTINYGAWHPDSTTLIMEIHSYTITAQAGDRVLFRVVNPVGDFNPYLSLLTSAGYTIASGGIPGTGIAEIISPALQESDTYNLLVRDFDGNGRGVYYLSVQCTNRPQNARLIEFDRAVRDTIVDYGRFRTYQFSAKAGETVSVQMINISGGLDPQIRLYSPGGKYVGGAVSGDYALLANRTLPDSGLYTLIASDDDGADTGEYFLIVLRVPTDAEDDSPGLPAAYVLEQNHPNPFNPQTTIEFTLLRTSLVKLSVYNILGENIRMLTAGTMPAGHHAVIWDGRDDNGETAPSGIYFYRLVADGFADSKKMLLLK